MNMKFKYIIIYNYELMLKIDVIKKNVLLLFYFLLVFPHKLTLMFFTGV